jgi:hypothetical protein
LEEKGTYKYNAKNGYNGVQIGLLGSGCCKKYIRWGERGIYTIIIAMKIQAANNVLVKQSKQMETMNVNKFYSKM